MDYFYQQVQQKDVTRRLQVGQDLIDYLNDPQRSPDVEQDKSRLDKTIDELTGWINSSNFKVRHCDKKSSNGGLRVATAVCTAAVVLCQPVLEVDSLYLVYITPENLMNGRVGDDSLFLYVSYGKQF